MVMCIGKIALLDSFDLVFYNKRIEPRLLGFELNWAYNKIANRVDTKRVNSWLGRKLPNLPSRRLNDKCFGVKFGACTRLKVKEKKS